MLTEACRLNGGILLNKSGKRFTNECGMRDDVCADILAQEGKMAYLVLDQEIASTHPAISRYITTGVLTECKSFDEQAAFIGTDGSNVEESISRWNEMVANKEDTDFQSAYYFVRGIGEGPYYIVDIAPGIHHCMGGVKIDPEAHVISSEGRPINGLFATGEVTGGVHGGNRCGGNAITDIIVFGRIAGSSAGAYVSGK